MHDDPCEISGEVDISNDTAFYARLARCVSEAEGPLVEVDCSRVRFIDVAGLRRIEQAARLAASNGCRLLLVNPSDAVERVVRAMGRTYLLAE